jgi:hypothetical protein
VLHGRGSEALMKSQDRNYFMMRAEEEVQAAARSQGPARGRHEELAAAYKLRVMYIDKGYGEPGIGPERAEETPLQQIIILA